MHPVSPATISDTFGTHSELRKSLGLGPHRGVDYAVKRGTPLKAVGSGTIVGVYESKILGWVVELRTYASLGKLRIFAYCHLDKAEVKVGQKVKQGDIIGKSGNSGSATSGAHLHFMCGRQEHLATSSVEDPLKWLPKIGQK
jgi:murein DD-endopeptidase MepM/ murein hydrolase activator NlpD